jgi:ABC-2 type transport system permease protein
MKSKTSFINQGILRNDFKSFGWIGGAYLLALLLSIPLKVIMMHSHTENSYINGLSNYLRIFLFDSNSSPLQYMLLILVPVLTGLMLFRYMQTSPAADMAHSLPIKRETLYNTHIFAGVIFLFVPLIITALVSWAVVAGLGIESVSGLRILIWLASALLFNLLFFMTSVAVGMITGMSALQAILSYILLLLPTGLLELLLHNMKMYIHGFAYGYYSYNISFSPLIKITEFYRYPFQAAEITVYLLVIIVLYLAGRYFYQHRQLEAAGNAITFDLLSPIFKYGVTFCSMLLLGSYYYGTQNESMGWTYFGYFLGSLLAYFLAEVLLNKSLHVFKPKILKGYGAYSLIIIILLAGLSIDFTGFEKKLPVLAEVESVYMDGSFYTLNEKNRPRVVVPQDTDIYLESESNILERPSQVFTEANNLANIYSLHQKIIANKAQEKVSLFSDNRKLRYEKICLAYNLKNGEHLYREYSITTPMYADVLKPIYEASEYKALRYDILRIDPAIINMIDINVSDTTKKVKMVNPEQIRQAIDALQKDTFAQTYEDMTSNRPGWANIELIINNKRSLGMSWNKSFVNFEEWLKKNGLYNQARIIPGEDISYALVERNSANSKEMEIARAKPTQHIIQDVENRPGFLKITDQEKLEICLHHYTYTDQQPYRVFFVLNNGGLLSGGFSEVDVPGFVKEHFAKQKAE